ncbi:uncharacterized protein [Misgurnus anguillicaudatus]|uniref:uncharacterized protein isoform X2 n=1 Tax=Misgurnus anguillicaudatus TaxID=75329 RepID=UPI003CCF41FA
MYVLNFLSLSVLLMIADGFTVKGPSGPLVVPLGGSVVLPCSVGSLLPLEDLEVEWRRSDSQTLIHLYQDEDIRPEAQHQDYHDRAHFFTEDIKNGNFSLMLNNLTAEDEGQYTCKVHTGQESGEIVVEIKDVERLIVSGSSQSISASVGGDVTLNCSVNSHIKPEEIEEVSWKKTNKGEPILVLLYQYNETLLDTSDDRYRDRVEFFADEIHRGNFSLRLKRVRTEDKGVYICQVFTGRLSANTTIILQQTDAVLRIQLFLVFCPNLIMFLAFVFWGVSEGSVNEKIFCCALFILRPLFLLFAAPYLNEFTGKIEILLKYSFEMNYISFTTVVFAVFFKTAREKTLNYTASERVMILVLFVIVLLLCLIYIFYMFAMISGKLSQRIETIFMVLARIIITVLPLLQFILLFYTFASAKGGFFIVAILPVITTVTRYNWNAVCGDQMGCSPLVMRLVWFILLLFMNALLIYFYNIALGNENDRVGWACMIGFLQVLWTVWNCLYTFRDWEYIRITAVYVFGSVGVVLISAVALMTELILKTINGEGLFGDLRIAVFSSESLFAASVLMLPLLAPWIKKDLQCCLNPIKFKKVGSTGSVHNQCSQTAAAFDETQATASNQNTAGESHETKHLLNTQESDRNTERGESQPDSVRSQP